MLCKISKRIGARFFHFADSLYWERVMETTEAELRLKAFDTVLEWSKQILTLTTAILVLTATFIKSLIPASQSMVCKSLLWWSWFSLGLSIFAGLCVLGSIAADYNSAKNGTKLDIFDGRASWFGIAQVLLFMAGVGLFLSFAGANMSVVSPSQSVAETVRTPSIHDHAASRPGK